MSVYEQLYDWQKKIVDKFDDRNAFGLFLDMGLGKTPISLAFAEQNKATQILIISINSKAEEKQNVKGSWLNWSTQLTGDWELLNKYSHIEDINAVFRQVLLINYESTFKTIKNKHDEKEHVINPLIEQFIKYAKDQNVVLILDESHKVKNLSSVQTKIINKIKTKLKLKAKKVYTYLLSGSPFTQGYIDLYSQLKFLGYDENKTQFIDQFCERGRVAGLLDWQQPIVGYKNLDKLYKLIHSYALTIMSDDVIDLPEQVFTYHKSKLSADFNMFVLDKVKQSYVTTYMKKQQLYYQPIKDDETKINNPFFRNLSFPDFDWFCETTGTFWLRARQISIGFQGNASDSVWFNRDRLNDIKQFLKDNRENYVIFYNYTPEMFELYDICEELNYSIDVYSGDIKSLYFYETYSEMSDIDRVNDKQNRVIIANFASGSTGMNWQLYNHCIIASVPLYKDWSQGIKRQHRIGSTKTVFYHIFCQDNWLDNGMLNSLQQTVDYNLDLFEADLKKQALLSETHSE